MPNLTFPQFRAKLADAVTVAINTPGAPKIAPRKLGGECCPLGALMGTLEEKSNSFPSGNSVANALGGDEFDYWKFIFGFDVNDGSNDPYTRLGRLYRQRFVENER